MNFIDNININTAININTNITTAAITSEYIIGETLLVRHTPKVQLQLQLEVENG